MAKKRTQGRSAVDEAEIEETRTLDDGLPGGPDPGDQERDRVKHEKAVRKRIAALDESVEKARRRLERRQERLVDAERVVRDLERELAAALREARALGVSAPGVAAAPRTRRREPRAALAAPTVPSAPGATTSAPLAAEAAPGNQVETVPAKTLAGRRRMPSAGRPARSPRRPPRATGSTVTDGTG